jgi:hypothetical protein
MVCYITTDPCNIPVFGFGAPRVTTFTSTSTSTVYLDICVPVELKALFLIGPGQQRTRFHARRATAQGNTGGEAATALGPLTSGEISSAVTETKGAVS